MVRLLPWLTVTVKDGHRGILTRNGVFERILAPGKYRLADFNGDLACEMVGAVRAEFPIEWALMIAARHPQVATEHFAFVRPGEGEIAIVSFDGQPKHLVPEMVSRAFWKVDTVVDVITVNTQGDLRVPASIVNKIDFAHTRLALDVQIAAHELGLLSVDGVITETLQPGRHTFWQTSRKLAVQKLDLRPQPLEVTAQEILTKDKVGVRLTLTAFYRIVDPTAAVKGATDTAAALYRLVQFAVREAVASRTLDDLLTARADIDAEIRAFVEKRTIELGVATTELGIKDVILPGDVRELINKVVEAERTARANIIRRQEETAATRSLLNTAKLMADNPLLVRLKELEALEKLTEKVGKIDLHAGSGVGLDALVQNLWRFGVEGDKRA